MATLWLKDNMQMQLGLLLLSLAGTVICQRGCTPPAAVLNGRYTPQKVVYEYNSNVTYYCEDGYELDEELNTRSCVGIRFINAYSWSGNDPECVPISCSTPSIPDATFSMPELMLFKSKFSYRCHEGLVPLGDQTAECTADRTWSYTLCQTPEFACDRNKIPTVAHATHNASASAQQPSGTVIRYTCQAGYYSKVVAGDLKCVGTEWTGTVPSCTVEPTSDSGLLPANQPTDQGDGSISSSSVKIELPIIAGVVTALILTTVLLITIYCLRKRKQETYSQKAGSVVSGTTNSSGPTDVCVTPNQSFRLPRHTSAYPDLQLHATVRSHTPTSAITSPVPPALPLSQPPNTSSPRSGVSSSDNTASEAEFHTIRECLGDFRNNNNPPPVVHTHSCPKLNTQQHTHPAQPYGCSRTINPASNRPVWPHSHHIHSGIVSHTCGRSTPYETVTCPHGVEHVYQPLEHVYEEPRIWMQPLPNPQSNTKQ